MLKETIQNAQKNDTDGLSHMQLCQRVEKTPENEYGFQLVDTIPFDKPAVLVLGGNSSTTNRAANGYMSEIEKFLKERGINAGIYSITYDFKHHDTFERQALFGKYHVSRNGHRFFYPSETEYYMINEDGFKAANRPFPKDAHNPNYVKELFDKAFLSRITDRNGNKLPVNEACRRIRNLTVCAHCHGAYVFLKTEELLQKKMAEVGFSAEERAKIQKELLCVAFAPDTPLGISKSTMISFVSPEDDSLRIENNFKKEIFPLRSEFDIAYFPEKQGEVFIASKINDYVDDGFASDKDHYFLMGIEQDKLTNAGKTLSLFFGNALAEGVKNSIEGKPLPPVKDLVSGEDEKNKSLFEQAKEKGCVLWDKIIKNARKRLSAKHTKQNG